jgi:pimeloyl-ACP methyl ester carboxylesterase
MAPGMFLPSGKKPRKKRSKIQKAVRVNHFSDIIRCIICCSPGNKKVILLFSVFLSTFVTIAQPFLIGQTTLHFTDPLRGNRKIAVEIFYPADSAGCDIPLAGPEGLRFPVLCFGHGFLLPVSAYRNIREAVVPEGYIIAFPKSERGLHPSHPDLAKDLAFVIRRLSWLGQEKNSLFYNRIDSVNCCMGHSMGGGSAVLAARMEPSIRSLVLFAPYETNPSAAEAAGGIDIPTLIISGSNDCITPSLKYQDPLFQSLMSQDKIHISIKGGSHCQMLNSSFLCKLGEKTCRPNPAITASEQHAIIDRYLIEWLNSRLKKGSGRKNDIMELLQNDQSVTYTAK